MAAVPSVATDIIHVSGRRGAPVDDERPRTQRLSCSVVVPATNRPPTLSHCLDAVRAAVDGDVEVSVVDDLPTRSPARIRNEGARRARGEILVFVDADVVVHPRAIDHLRAAFVRDPGLAAAFGSYDDDPPFGLVSQFRNLLHHHIHQQSAGDVHSFWAGMGAVRRDVFLAVGGFDERRFPRPMLEDLELGLRLDDAGHRIVSVPQAQGRHMKRWTLRSMLRTDLCDRGIPWMRLLIERRRLPATLNLGWRHRLSAATVLSTAIALAATRQGTAAVLGAARLVALNRTLYGRLMRCGGLKLAAVGLGLHVLHHVAAIAALPCGVVAHLSRGSTPVTLPQLEPVGGAGGA